MPAMPKRPIDESLYRALVLSDQNLAHRERSVMPLFRLALSAVAREGNRHSGGGLVGSGDAGGEGNAGARKQALGADVEAPGLHHPLAGIRELDLELRHLLRFERDVGDLALDD